MDNLLKHRGQEKAFKKTIRQSGLDTLRSMHTKYESTVDFPNEKVHLASFNPNGRELKGKF